MNGLVLSASQINTYLMCARKYAFRYVERVEPEFHSSALAFGSSVHSALEHFHMERMEGRSPSPQDVAAVFRSDFASEQERELRFKPGEDATSLAEQGERLVVMYVERYHDIEPVAVEPAFEIPLVDPHTGETLGPSLRGYLDLVLAGDRVVELKTAAKKPDPVDLDRRLQFSAYAYAWRQIHGRDPTLVVRTLVKSKRQVTIEETVTERTVDDDAFFVATAMEVAKGIEAGVYPPSPGWLCSECEYGRACGAWRCGIVQRAA